MARHRRGRLAVAEQPPSGGRDPDPHPVGAVDLTAVVLCVPTAELPAYERRYADYLERHARDDGPTRVFDLDGSRVVLVADTDLGTILPGEEPPALSAFVAYAVAVDDLAVTASHVTANGFPLRETGSGDLFVPAAAAMGTAVIFSADLAGGSGPLDDRADRLRHRVDIFGRRGVAEAESQ